MQVSVMEICDRLTENRHNNTWHIFYSKLGFNSIASGAEYSNFEQFHTHRIYMYILQRWAPAIFSVVHFRWSAIQKQCLRFTLVHYFQKFDSPLALVRYSAIAIFSVVCCHQSAIPLFRYRIFTIVHCYQSAILLPLFSLQSTILQYAIPQFAIPQFAIPQFVILQFAIPQITTPQFAIQQFAIQQFAIPQFAIPQFAIPQYQYWYRYQPPSFFVVDNFFSLKYF